MGKQNLTLNGLWPSLAQKSLTFGLILALWALGQPLVNPALAATNRLVGLYVSDPLSGVALGGYDAISYFTDEEPNLGRADFEVFWSGVPWFFSSAANRDIFLRAPEVYAPQFGGHGTMSMARGYLSDGNPLIYQLRDNRLYLFYSLGNREAFSLANHSARLRATEKWRVLKSTLPRL